MEEYQDVNFLGKRPKEETLGLFLHKTLKGKLTTWSNDEYLSHENFKEEGIQIKISNTDLDSLIRQYCTNKKLRIEDEISGNGSYITIKSDGAIIMITTSYFVINSSLLGTVKLSK